MQQPLFRARENQQSTSYNLKGLWHGQKWLHLFVDSEAYLPIIEAQTQRPLFWARENRQSASYNLSFLDVVRGWRSLGY